MVQARLQQLARLALAAAWLVVQAPRAAMAQPEGHQPKDSSYPLDDIERVIPAKGPVRCPTVAKVRYAGTSLRYQSSVMVAEPFAPRLAAFEAIVAEAAYQHYGRPPKTIRHIGTYNCRRIAAWPTFLSEHGLANGIDIAGFDFAPAPKALRASLAPALRGRFDVRVKRHWRSSAASDAVHRAFLHDLARRLVAATEVFRVVLGPGYPGHEDHMHLDCAPWRLIVVDLDPVPGVAGE